MIYSVVFIPLKAGTTPFDVFSNSAWTVGRWHHIDESQTCPAIELAHSDLPPALTNLLSNENRVHIAADGSATKIGNHQVLAIEIVHPPENIRILGPVLLIHLSGPDTAGVSALLGLVPLLTQASGYLGAIGISVEAVATEQRAIVVTTAKAPASNNSSLIHVRHPELRKEFQFRTIYTEVATIAAMQQMAAFALRNSLPADRDNRKENSDFLDAAIGIRNSLWWRHISSHKQSAELLQDIRDHLKTDVQMEELLEQARDLRQNQELRATQSFNRYGFVFAVSALAAAWFPLHSEHLAIPVTGGVVTLALLCTVWLIRRTRK